ncbi:unnamed protein product [Lactuca virosa]|uniref:Uncharacterized protein n=1 Tax=Lactuca virosa TaxID=75947 RepID=A0AAU9MVL4_9ASTR|nr:unnamed protein product [Lactuca virosa]
MTTENTGEASETPRHPIRSMMSLKPDITPITTSYKSTTVVTNALHFGGPMKISTPMSELWRPRMEELIPFTNTPPQNFPLNNHQVTSILSNITPPIVQTTVGTFTFIQTPPPPVNQVVGEQTTTLHATSSTTTTPLSTPLQQFPPFTTNQLFSTNQPFSTNQMLTTSPLFTTNPPLTFPLRP